MAEEKENSKQHKVPISLVDAFASLKSGSEEAKVTFNSHIIFGVEVNSQGDPTSILMTLQAGGYVGLGMLDALQIMIDNARDEMSHGFEQIIEKSQTGFTAPSGSIKGPKYNPEKSEPIEPVMTPEGGMIVGNVKDEDITNIIKSYSAEITDAILAKDEKRLAELKMKIVSEIKAIKGDDFDGKIIIGGPDLFNSLPPNMFPPGFKPPNGENGGFSLDDIEKLF